MLSLAAHYVEYCMMTLLRADHVMSDSSAECRGKVNIGSYGLLTMFRFFDRKRWVLLFDFLAKYAEKPISIHELYSIIVREGPRLDFRVSLEELKELIREFKDRGIVNEIRVDHDEYIVLTEDARYFVHIYSTSIIGL